MSEAGPMRTMATAQRRPADWRRGGATALLAAVLVLEILGLADLGRTAYSGLLLRNDRTVGRVAPQSPAARAGFEKGDVLREAPPRTPRPGDTRLVQVNRGDRQLTLTLTYSALPPSETARRFSLGLVALSFFLVGYVVFLRRHDETALVFALLCLDVGLVITNLMHWPSWLLGIHPVADMTVYSALSLLLAPLFLHFFLIFPERQKILQHHPRLVPLLYLPGVACVIIAIPLNAHVVREGGVSSPGVTLFESIGLIYFLAASVLGVFSFVISFQRTKQPVIRRRLKGVVIGTACGLLPLWINVALVNIFPGLEIPGDRFAVLSLVLIPLAFGHAIVRYGLLDVEIFLKRGVVYTILIAAVVATYLGVVTGLGRWVEASAPPGSRTALTLMALFFLATIFSPLRLGIEHWVDRTFYREQYSYRQTLRDLSRALARMMDLEQVLDLLTSKIDETLHPEEMALFLRSLPGGEYAVVRSRGERRLETGLAFRAEDELPRWLAARGEPVALERLPPGGLFAQVSLRERRLLARMKAAVLVPMVAEGELAGFLVLGPKRSQELMSTEDVELLGTLADHAATAIQNARHHDEALVRQKLEQELRLAREVQRTLLPHAHPEIEGLEFAGLSLPSTEIGGDLYDYITLSQGRLAVTIGDAMGHGIPAALLMASLQATVRGESAVRGGPRAVVSAANRTLCQRADESRFASLVYGEIDVWRGLFTYVNAGHPPPILVRPGAAGPGPFGPNEELRYLDKGGLILGIDPEAQYEEETVRLAPGAVLLFYTDGIVDETGTIGEEFGRGRLAAILKRHCHMPPEQVIREIHRALTTHAGSSLGDDATLLLMRHVGRPSIPRPEVGAEQAASSD